MNNYLETCTVILQELTAALNAVDPKQVEQFVDAILQARQIFVIAVGRSLLSLQALAKRLNHLGIACHCVGAINEPAITKDDLLVVTSGSGESVIPVAIARVAHKYGAKIVHLGSNPHSSLAPLTDLFVRIPVRTKLALPEELESQQIMSSLFERAVLLLSDAVTLMIAERRQLNLQDLWQHHANLE
jgi:6-phospho-3-hexuloisomerase